VFRGVNLLYGENGNCSFREKHIAYDERLILVFGRKQEAQL